MGTLISAIFAALMTGAISMPAFAQEGKRPAQQQSGPAAPAAPATKKKVNEKALNSAPVKQPAAVGLATAPVEETVNPLPPPVTRVEVATAVPAAVGVPSAPPVVSPQSCPGCFQPLLEGYNGIIADLKPWMDEMAAQAADLDRRLSEIQKRINEKDDAIEKANLGTDRKAAKAAVKALNKERKTILKEYTGTSDKKDEFYNAFSKEVEKKVEGYNKINAIKLQMTLSAASR